MMRAQGEDREGRWKFQGGKGHQVQSPRGRQQPEEGLTLCSELGTRSQTRKTLTLEVEAVRLLKSTGALLEHSAPHTSKLHSYTPIY